MKLLLLAGFCASTVLCIAAVTACASDASSPSSSTDSEDDASAETTKPKGDAGRTDGGDASGTALSTCEQTRSYFEDCAQELTCGNDFDTWCAANDQAINSDAFRRAEAKCLTKANCDGNDRRACEYGSYATATPTTAQKAIVEAYCATCEPDDAAGCAKRQTTYNSAAGPKSVSDLFVAAWELADPLVDEIRTKCTGDALDGGAGDAAACAKAFSLCAGDIYIAKLPECPK
ncbi:hypothetical protein AKJ09_02087 [Labilithrix luteola]|uniref:Lipoprotein n=1 Tax=Labilithrix luteola TaxID=1391654 RepID=A0A0K1PPH0_9BACT|nr:hypothetical protein [Labilithrix luteola]AKU95423.1 hypothetical protein AKJ09_02087 [Labilithrix luteola]